MALATVDHDSMIGVKLRKLFSELKLSELKLKHWFPGATIAQPDIPGTVKVGVS